LQTTEEGLPPSDARPILENQNWVLVKSHTHFDSLFIPDSLDNHLTGSIRGDQPALVLNRVGGTSTSLCRLSNGRFVLATAFHGRIAVT
jgi:hypothetical protein